MWLTNFKKALILKEFEKLMQLIEEIPHLETLHEIEEAAFLLDQAKTLFETEKSTTLTSLQQIKNTLDFLKATENPPVSSINFKL